MFNMSTTFANILSKVSFHKILVFCCPKKCLVELYLGTS